MKFALVDRILEVRPGERIVAIKAVSLAEEYLADHFPSFPVLPGVLMLETLTEAAAWLVRATEDFTHSTILLAGAKNVTYKHFLKPGSLLQVEVTCRRMAPGESEFQGVGRCDGREVVKARFSLRHFNLVDRQASWGEMDRRLVADQRQKFAMLASLPST